MCFFYISEEEKGKFKKNRWIIIETLKVLYWRLPCNKEIFKINNKNNEKTLKNDYLPFATNKSIKYQNIQNILNERMSLKLTVTLKKKYYTLLLDISNQVHESI